MAKDDRSFVQRLSEAGMVFGDAVSGIYGQRGNTYSNYLDAQLKRQQMEYEAQKDAEARALEALKYQNTLSQQEFENMAKLATHNLSLQKAKTDETKMMLDQGFRPINKGTANQLGKKNPIELRNMMASSSKDAFGKRYMQPLTVSEQMAQFGNNLPVGSYGRVRIPGMGSVSVPLNPKLTEDEKSSIAGTQKFSELAKEVTGYIDKGVVSKNSWKQFLAEHGENALARMATPDNSDLEKLASARSEMIKYVFSEGGKQLTSSEKDIVKAGLDFVGKSDGQIKKDFNRAIDILRNKGLLTIGGKNAASKQLSAASKSEEMDDLSKLWS